MECSNRAINMGTLEQFKYGREKKILKEAQ